MHSVVPQSTIADQNLYVMLFFVLLVHSIITYLLFKFEAFIENFFGIEETCVKVLNETPNTLQQTSYASMRTDLFFS